MKYFYYLLLLIQFGLYQEIFSQGIENDIRFTEEEKQKYIGVYVFEENGNEKIRKIMLEDEIFFYVVNEELRIPLKPESKLKFNLYPSATYLFFEFNDNGNIESLLIKKGSGGTMKGKKLKNYK